MNHDNEVSMLDLMAPWGTPAGRSLTSADSPAKFTKNFKVSFWSQVAKLGPEMCWPWMGGRAERYGVFRQYRAHRVAYELAIGPIPEGLTIDHVVARGCKGGPCCNPAHLEVVTQSENSRRHQATLPQVLQCELGHEPRKRGSGPCKKCMVIRVARSQKKNPEKYREMQRLQKRKERARKKAGS